MWALPALTTNEAADIDQQLGVGGLWSLLLFRKEDAAVLCGLERNWAAFDAALGKNAHIITLLDISRRNDRVSLRFPGDYESAVGNFCNCLEVPLDELPALVLLNGRSEQFDGTPYWSFQRGDLKESSDALIRLVGDMQRATRTSPSLDEPAKAEWLTQATKRLLTSASGREMRGLIMKNPSVVVSLLKVLFNRVSGSGS